MTHLARAFQRRIIHQDRFYARIIGISHQSINRVYLTWPKPNQMIIFWITDCLEMRTCFSVSVKWQLNFGSLAFTKFWTQNKFKVSLDFVDYKHDMIFVSIRYLPLFYGDPMCFRHERTNGCRYMKFPEQNLWNLIFDSRFTLYSNTVACPGLDIVHLIYCRFFLGWQLCSVFGLNYTVFRTG